MNARKQIARSTIHLNSIPGAQIIDGVIYIQNSNWDHDQHSEGRFNDAPVQITENLLGVTETQPNLNDEEDRRYWGDNELDSSNSDCQITLHINTRGLLDGNSDKSSKSKHRKKLKRTLNTVISKPRICKRRKDKAGTSTGSNTSKIKAPNWNFSNLPIAKCYRQDEDSLSTDSEEDIRVVRKEDWRKWRAYKRKKLQISYISGASSVEDEEVCICCITGPQDTILVHENTGHLCCCYTCAKELWEQGVVCPVCGLEVTRIINI